MGARIYPVQPVLDGGAGYRVKIDGAEAALNKARVSACPYNRRWPGHQRTMDQTEIAAFLSMETDGAVEIEIEADEAFEQVVVRPLSLGIVAQTDGKKIRFRLEKPGYVTVEPYGRRNALHIFADPVKKYEAANENLIYFGPGEHDAGMIELKSGQTLWIDEGAVVYGCVRAMDAEDIRILGRGILDNSRNKAKILYEVSAEGNDMAVDNAERIHTVQLEYCTNVEIDGITIRDSLVYNIRPVGCRGLSIRNVKIIGCWRYNSDGIDMHNCEDVLIENCFLRTFDDSICVKGFDCYYEGDVEAAVQAAMYRNGQSYDVFRNVLVRGCVIWNDWGKALEIGAETRAEEICDILFEDCDVIHVTGPVLDCMNVDYADVHDVTYRNIRVEYDEVIPQMVIQEKNDVRYEDVEKSRDCAPPLMCVEVLYHPEYSAGGTRRGRNRRILFEDIFLTGRQKPYAVVRGIDAEHNSREITIRNLRWNGERAAGLNIDSDAVCTDISVETDCPFERLSAPLLYQAAQKGAYGQRREYDSGSITDALFVYLDGQPSPEMIGTVETEYRGRPLVCLTAGWEDHIARAYPQAKVFRRWMMKPASRFSTDGGGCLPDGYSVALFDERAFGLHPFSHGTNYPSFDAFHRQGAGAVVWHDGRIVSAASSFLTLDGEVELDVSTDEAHRRKGLAAACVALMLRDCAARGLTVHWDAQNEASRRLAGKFGFEEAFGYSVCFLSEQ